MSLLLVCFVYSMIRVIALNGIAVLPFFRES